MNGCAITRGRVPCKLSEGHAGRHSFESEEEFLERVAPDAAPATPAELSSGCCPQCGPAASDEDGCCVQCGATVAAWQDVARWVADRPTVAPAVVDLGAHYRARGGVEPIDFITSNNLTFCEGNVVKYVTRWQAKNGIEDLRKARWYIDRLIAQAEGEGK